MKWLAEARVIRHPKGHAYETRFNWIVVWRSKVPGKRLRLIRDKGPGFCEEIYARWMLYRFLCAGHKVVWTRKALKLQCRSPGCEKTMREFPPLLEEAIRVLAIPVPEKGDPDYEEEPRNPGSHHGPVEWGTMEGVSDDE